MLSKSNHKGRQLLAPIIILFLLACAKPTLWFVTQEDPSPDRDSLITDFFCENITGTLDLFIYEDSGLRILEHYCRVQPDEDAITRMAQPGEDTLTRRVKASGDGPLFSYSAGPGDKIALGILSDGSIRPDPAALSRFDSAEEMVLRYKDESAARPVGIALAQFHQGEKVYLLPKGFLSAITLRSISHSFAGYRRLEEPLCYLQKVNASVPALQENGFRPVETISDTAGLQGLMWECLPCDIGFYPQYPSTTVYAYPFEEGVDKMEFVVEGIYCGDTVRFMHTIGSIRRGERIILDLEIGVNPVDYSYFAEIL